MTIGYDPNFIGDGISIPLPTFNPTLSESVLHRPSALRNEIFLDKPHFTVVMNERRPLWLEAPLNPALR